MPTRPDLWESYLISLGYSGSRNDMLRQALSDETGLATKVGISQLWYEYLIQQGYTGTRNDMMYAYLGDKGYTGGLSQRIYDALVAGDIFASSDSISCAYPLDASNEELVVALGTGRLSNVSADQQEGERVIVGGLSANTLERMAPTGLPNPGSLLSLTEGTYAVEFKVTNDPTYTGTNTGASLYLSGLLLVGPGFSPLFGAGIQKNINGTFNVIDSANQPVVSNLPTLPVGVAIVYDADAGEASIRYNGVNYGTTAVDLSSCFIILSCNEEAGIDPVNAGKAVRVRAETNAAEYDGSYAPGTTDPCGNVITTPVFCVYPLDAAEATIQGAGYQGKLVPSESDTKGSRTIADGVLSAGTQIMANAGVFTADPGAFYDFTVGKKAIEFEVFVDAFTPEDGLQGGLLTQVSAGLTTGAANPLYIFYNLLEDSERVTGIGSSRGTEYTTGVQTPSTAVARIGILVDSVAAVVRAWVDGVEVALLDDSLPAGLSAVAPYLAIEHVGADDNGAAGITQYAKVYTTASDFTSPFPAGTTDPCGNPV